MKRTARKKEAILQPRKYNRYDLKVPVIFEWKGEDGIRRKQVGLTHDISVGGAAVFAMTPPPVNAYIKLKAFRLPVGQTLPMRMFGKGQVVRVEAARGRLPGGFAVAAGRIAFHKWAGAD
ncbi:MAG: PilZ domain-containing protein [Terriglobia bacterium]